MPATPSPLSDIRIAIIGGYSLTPLKDLIEQLLFAHGYRAALWTGDYDNYVAEILDSDGALYGFAPEVVFVLPSGTRAAYPGGAFDDGDAQSAHVDQTVEDLLSLCRSIRSFSRADVVLANFLLPARHDLGALRTRSLTNEWSFKKAVNLRLGLRAPEFVHICDLEFLGHRIGGLTATDDRARFESKQIGSSELLVAIAHEFAQNVNQLRRAPKKLLVVDLDNTLWGGVIGDDGLDGIEIGDTSPRGEAFKAFQHSLKVLQQRGVLLAVCSKNDDATARAPFLAHPEMVLRLEHFAAFKASWQPKSEAIREIADELNLGLDSIVFVDDNPAEIAIVNQFVPDVTTILLGPDAADYAGTISDCRLFEPRSLTKEDGLRTAQYAQERERRTLLGATTDMASYLTSLEMVAEIRPFSRVDVPRIAQLINKSNQFNLTTVRRSEGEVTLLLDDPDVATFTVRLRDRFGDHGLIAVVIARVVDTDLHIDTLLMSCRVLKRQVEDEVINEVVRLGLMRGCRRIVGRYVPTPKNGMVKDFYSEMGFAASASGAFHLDVSRPATPTHIQIRRPDESR